MDMKIRGLPGSVVIIGLVYVLGMAFAPRPGLSAEAAAALQAETEPTNADTGRSTPPPAMGTGNQRTGYLGAHATPASDAATCGDFAVKHATLRYAQQLHRSTADREPAIGPAPPGRLTFF